MISVTLQRNTLATIFFPTTLTTWTMLCGAEMGIPLKNLLIFLRVKGPPKKVYKCRKDEQSFFIKVSVTGRPTDDMTRYCKALQTWGGLCAECPVPGSWICLWRGVRLQQECWAGKQWPNHVVQKVCTSFYFFTPVSHGRMINVDLGSKLTIPCKRSIRDGTDEIHCSACRLNSEPGNFVKFPRRQASMRVQV